MIQFGQKLAQLREGKCLSQEQLAEQLGVSRQTISNWENDKVSPDVNMAAQICRFFGVDMNALFLADDGSTTVNSDTQGKTQATAQKTNSIEVNLGIWKTSLVISIVMCIVFAALTILAACLLADNAQGEINSTLELGKDASGSAFSSTLSVKSILTIAGLCFAGAATVFSAVMLIISAIMYQRCKKAIECLSEPKQKRDASDKVEETE